MDDHPQTDPLNAALAHHKAGRLNEAEAMYRQVLTTHPDHPDALHLLGAVARSAGRAAEAVELIRRALIFTPDLAEVWYNLGTALLDLPDPPAAVAAFSTAIEKRPGFPQAWVNLGKALALAGRDEESVAACRRAVEIRPEHVPGLIAYGRVLKNRRRFDESAAVFRRAVALAPGSAEALCGLGGALNDCQNYTASVDVLRIAITTGSRLDEALNNLGVALFHLGRHEEAVGAYRQAVAHRPDFPEAWCNLGGALQECHRYDESIAASTRALALRPEYPKAHHNLGLTLLATGRCDAAVSAYRRAVELAPDDPVMHSSLIFAAQHDPRCTAADVFTEQRAWNDRHAEPLKNQIRSHDNDRDPGRRLRVGYVSADLRAHPVGRFLLPLLSNHDRSRVEIFAYSGVETPDPLTTRLREQTDHWREIARLGDPDAADLIRRDRIDILIDLGMHTGKNRLPVFARKPAPVQVTWLACPAGTGLTAIDYRLTDPNLDPDDRDAHLYAERAVRLPETWWCYCPDDQQQVPPVRFTSDPAETVCFGCLNNFSKVNDTVLDVWSRLLRSLPGSRLLLFADPGSHRGRAVDRLGIGPGRVEFVPFQPRIAYFQTYNRIDIGLDTFPYSGGTTTCDAVWMGVPVVSLIGKTALGRAGFGIGSQVGLGDLAADSVEKYLETAAGLASDRDRLARLRADLRGAMLRSPLTDAPRFARNFEAALRDMWARWCKARRR